MVSIDNRSPEAEQANNLRLEHIIASWREREAELIQLDSNAPGGGTTRNPLSEAPERYHTALYRQVRVLTARTWIVTIRDPMGMLGSLIEAIGMAIIMGWVSTIFV